MHDISALVRAVPDFPKPGILFRDITPVLAHPAAFAQVIDALAALAALGGPTHVVGIESRGFILGVPLATRLGLPFIPARKPGKLPCAKVRSEYALEYGTDALEMHADALKAGDRVAIVDDLLATGGTAAAVCGLAEQLGAQVSAILVMIELTGLAGAAKLAPRTVHSLLRY